MRSVVTSISLISVLMLVCLQTLPLQADQSNFQFLPIPIAYPSFEKNHVDFNASVDYFKLSTEDKIDLTAFGSHFILRGACSEHVALSLMIGLMGTHGDVPGLALPFDDGVWSYTPVVDGKGKLTGIGAPLALNLEVQAIHKPFGDLLLFFGPNFSIASLTIDTPYHAVAGSTVLDNTTFERKAIVFLDGAQIGFQAGVNLGPVTLAPFTMITLQSGSASYTFDAGYTGGPNTVIGDGPAVNTFLTDTVGMNFIFRPWNLILGTQIQRADSTGNQSGYTNTLFNLAMHFGGK